MVFERKYSQETREAATAQVLDRLEENPRDRHAITEVAAEYGIGPQSLRSWVRRARGGATPADAIGATNGDSLAELRAEIEELRRQQEILRNENHILKQAFKIFTSDWETPAS